MQMLVMHREDNHQQPRPVQVVETAGNQKRRAEKVSRPTTKMGSSEDDFIFKCLFESYKRSCQLTDNTDIRDQLLACCETDLRRDLYRYLSTGVATKSEVELMAEIKKIAVITRSNLGQELLSQSPKLSLEQSVAFIEAKEQGKRSHKALEGSVASGEVNKVTAYQQQKELRPCKFCGRLGHGESPSLSVRKEKCPA